MERVVLDDEVAAGLAAFPAMTFTNESIVMMREGLGSLAVPELSEAVERSDHVVSDAPHVVVRVHRPAGRSAALPCLFWMHGGGYVIGSYAAEDARFDTWCGDLPFVGVSVEYRLAPESPYPGPLDDCYAGLRWIYEHAVELGIDRDRIGVGGLSAGGGLAAALALLARDRGEVPVAFQLLESPMLDDRQVTPSSRVEDLPIWSRDANTFGWRSYLGDRYGTDEVPYTAAAARATDLVGLPPALVIVGGADGFCDEDVDYATRLNQASVSTALHVLPGACHGVQQICPDTEVSRQWGQLVDTWLAAQLR